MSEISDFSYKWQSLIGSGLGPFLAVLLSAIGFWLKSIIENNNVRNEAHRRIEIAMSRSLNDAFVLREELKWMTERIRELIKEGKSIRDPKVFFMNRINFPGMREVYRDQDISNFKVRSYYIHNKLLFLDAGIKETNEAVAGLKNDFEDIVRQNGLLVAVMRDNPNPPVQRQTYTDNLDAFANAIETYAAKSVNDGIETMAELKVYNNLLREKYGYFVWWKYEGTRFKYFRTKSKQKAFKHNLDSLEVIDAVIKEKVQKIIIDAEKRAEKLISK